MNVDALIDAFVQKLLENRWEKGLLDEEELPEFLRDGETEHDLWQWWIRPWDCRPWIDPFIETLPARLPSSFYSLISRYAFPAGQIGSIFLFGNTGHGGYYDWAEKVRLDEGMWPLLFENRLLQIGNPINVNYDPVCFDASRGDGDDMPIVQLDHEMILCNNEIFPLRVISPSFRQWVEDHLADASPAFIPRAERNAEDLDLREGAYYLKGTAQAATGP